MKPLTKLLSFLTLLLLAITATAQKPFTYADMLLASLRASAPRNRSSCFSRSSI